MSGKDLWSSIPGYIDRCPVGWAGVGTWYPFIHYSGVGVRLVLMIKSEEMVRWRLTSQGAVFSVMDENPRKVKSEEKAAGPSQSLYQFKSFLRRLLDPSHSHR